MEQYKQKRQLPRLLQSVSPTSVTIINEVAELDFGNKKLFVPTVEAFQQLVKKVAVLEQRLGNVDNKASRAIRQSYDRG